MYMYGLIVYLYYGGVWDGGYERLFGIDRTIICEPTKWCNGQAGQIAIVLPINVNMVG